MKIGRRNLVVMSRACGSNLLPFYCSFISVLCIRQSCYVLEAITKQFPQRLESVGFKLMCGFCTACLPCPDFRFPFRPGLGDHECLWVANPFCNVSVGLFGPVELLMNMHPATFAHRKPANSLCRVGYETVEHLAILTRARHSDPSPALLRTWRFLAHE